MGTKLLKRWARWILREERAANLIIIEEMVYDMNHNANKYFKCQKDLALATSRIDQLRRRAGSLSAWVSDHQYLGQNNLLRFAVDYLSQGEEGIQGVHPAQRWAIPGAAGWENTYGR